MHSLQTRILSASAAVLLLAGCETQTITQRRVPSADSPADPDAVGPVLPTVTVPARTSADAPAAKPVYVCPMHPGVTSDRPGRCPKCGMALVPLTKGDAHAGH